MSGTKGNLLLCLFLTYAVAAGNSESQFERWTGDLYEAFKAISTTECRVVKDAESILDICPHLPAITVTGKLEECTATCDPRNGWLKFQIGGLWCPKTAQCVQPMVPLSKRVSLWELKRS
ncbi:hypothetical protein CAPTEDRAFT_188691 [Capitella teleta]|uniref:Sushi domain-containing protein n=1 Tax=Capitella teleta TaxID=283909 RepID=R7VGX0_CAPTE|nr:hypothetical protein CAPTEDRAFT_188691 [Capitella teleta]|eukprot:ELU14940.1 hypothetical protein CAPTEDRAFT_188691 [Capitella teleta]